MALSSERLSPHQPRPAWQPLWPFCAMRSHTRLVRGHYFYLSPEVREQKKCAQVTKICYFLTLRGLCGVAQLWALSEDCSGDELPKCPDSFHGPLCRTLCLFRHRCAGVDLLCHGWHISLFVPGRNGKAFSCALNLMLNRFWEENDWHTVHCLINIPW